MKKFVFNGEYINEEIAFGKLVDEINKLKNRIRVLEEKIKPKVCLREILFGGK